MAGVRGWSTRMRIGRKGGSRLKKEWIWRGDREEGRRGGEGERETSKKKRERGDSNQERRGSTGGSRASERERVCVGARRSVHEKITENGMGGGAKGKSTGPGKVNGGTDSRGESSIKGARGGRREGEGREEGKASGPERKADGRTSEGMEVRDRESERARERRR
eukprot:scaffold29922_cov13-Tisochrysis_lutea.AAC.1